VRLPCAQVLVRTNLLTSSALNLLQEDRSRGTFGLKDAAFVKALIKATELGSGHPLCQQAEQWKQTSTKNVRNCAMAMEEVRGRWCTAACCVCATMTPCC
jgi:hypothetical protein